MTGPSGRGAVLRSPGMPALLVVTTAGFSGYAALIAVAPLWAVRGGADEVGAGLVNAVLLLSTVAAQTGVPWALNRFGHPVVIGVGLVLLGLPALGYGLSDALGPVLVMSALRGVGFADNHGDRERDGGACWCRPAGWARPSASTGSGSPCRCWSGCRCRCRSPTARVLGGVRPRRAAAGRDPGGRAARPGGDRRAPVGSRSGRRPGRPTAGEPAENPDRADRSAPRTCSAGSARPWSSCSRSPWSAARS